MAEALEEGRYLAGTILAAGVDKDYERIHALLRAEHIGAPGESVAGACIETLAMYALGFIDANARAFDHDRRADLRALPDGSGGPAFER